MAVEKVASDLLALPKIDAHHHLWDLQRNSYPWLTANPPLPSVAGDVSPIAHTYDVEDYLAEAKPHNIVKSVHVDAGIASSDPFAETRWLQDVADVHGFPHAIVAGARLDAADIESILEGLQAFPNVRGIRHIVNWHVDPVKTYVDRPDLLIDPNWKKGFQLLRHYGLSFDLQLYPSQMKDAAALARTNSDIPIIVNHAGMPVDRDAGGLSEWREGMRLLAECENVFVKISGLGMVDWNWSVQSISPFISRAVDLFGFDRCMFGSNFPVDRLYSSFDTLYEAFYRICDPFSDDEKEKLFLGNAARIYRL